MDYALAFSLTIGLLYWLTRKQKPYTVSEWRNRMKELGIGVK